MENSKKIENRIWKYRTARGLKQSELAFLIGQKRSSQVSRYERGVVMPRFEQLTKLCCGLGIKSECLYPDAIQKWQEEVRGREEGLKKIKGGSLP